MKIENVFPFDVERIPFDVFKRSDQSNVNTVHSATTAGERGAKTTAKEK